MYCLNCGRQLSDGEEFCTSCGVKAGTAKLPVEQIRNVQPAPSAYPPAQKPKSKMPIAIIIVALIVIAVSAGILTAVLMGGNSGSSSSLNAASSSSAVATTTTSGTSAASSAAASSAATSAASEGVAAASASSPTSSAGADASTGSPSSQAAADAGEAATPAQVAAEPEPEPGAVVVPESQVQGQPGVDAPFWGVWIGAFTQSDLAQGMAADARSKGLPATVLVTTDWSNLNEDFYYVVTVGTSTDEFTARRLCAQAIDAGFDGAYVKYSGERR